ncbi:MAG: cytochrome C oxidase subunit IV family protein [Planctomycetota bacterium]
MSDVTYSPAAAGHAGHGDDHTHHATPPWLLLAVFFALITLTGATVVCADPTLKEMLRTYLNRQFFPMDAAAMSRMSLWVAMIIATVKASLVVLFFMHLIWDKPFNAIVAVGCFMFVALFIGFSMTDSVQMREHPDRARIYIDESKPKDVQRNPGELAPAPHH